MIVSFRMAQSLLTIHLPSGGKRELWRHTKIGNNVSVGTNATIMPVTICDHVVIGAGAVMAKSITKSGIYAGNQRDSCGE
jgi:acetyltransferase-like isoleucine patch superfamily enzyme